MHSRIIWLTALLFAWIHLAISIGLVLWTAATSQMSEWGMAIAACLTTFPLAEAYDRILSEQGVAVTVSVPILIGAVLYFTIGTCVGWGIVQSMRLRGKA